MNTGYIILNDKAIVSNDKGELREIDNMDNLVDILELENSRCQYENKLLSFEIDKDDLVFKRKDKTIDALCTGAISVATPFIAYGICKLFPDLPAEGLTRVNASSLIFASYFGAQTVAYFLSIPKKKKINNLDIKIDNAKLVINSIDYVLEIEKNKSHKISSGEKIVKNKIDCILDDDLDEYYYENYDNLKKEYYSNECKVINNEHTHLENAVLTKMLKNDTRLTSRK